jgi:hypothetical protein
MKKKRWKFGRLYCVYNDRWLSVIYERTQRIFRRYLMSGDILNIHSHEVPVCHQKRSRITLAGCQKPHLQLEPNVDYVPLPRRTFEHWSTLVFSYCHVAFSQWRLRSRDEYRWVIKKMSGRNMPTPAAGICSHTMSNASKLQHSGLDGFIYVSPSILITLRLLYWVSWKIMRI